MKKSIAQASARRANPASPTSGGKIKLSADLKGVTSPPQ